MADSLQSILNTIKGKGTAQALKQAFARFRPGGSEVTAYARTLTQSDNGRTFYLNSSSEFALALPLPFLDGQFTFIVKTAPSGASYTVVATSGIIIGNQNPVSGDAGDFGTADTTITFVDGQAVAGDKVEVFSDGTSWFAYAISKVAAGVTFT